MIMINFIFLRTSLNTDKLSSREVDDAYNGKIKISADIVIMRIIQQ